MSFSRGGGGGVSLPSTKLLTEIIHDGEVDITSEAAYTMISDPIEISLVPDNPNIPINVAILNYNAFTSVEVINNTNGIKIEVIYSIDGGATWETGIGFNINAAIVGLRSNISNGNSVIVNAIPTNNKILMRLAAFLLVAPTGLNKVKRARAAIDGMTVA